MIYNWLKNNLFRRLPSSCLLCLAKTNNQSFLCRDCEKDLPQNSARCLLCSAVFNNTRNREKQLVCGHCQRQPPAYHTSVIPALYATPVKQLISALKFHADLTAVPILANNFLAGLNRDEAKLPEVIIPVPLHKSRLRERGFNQALELARFVANRLDIALDYSLCQRHKATPFQSGLSARQRKKNLKNAFSVMRAHGYRHVAIFDDVVTTGTTVNELAIQLKKSGVETIEVWAIARPYEKI